MKQKDISDYEFVTENNHNYSSENLRTNSTKQYKLNQNVSCIKKTG